MPASINSKLTEQSHHSWPSRALTSSKKSAKDIDLLCILRCSNKASHHAPYDLETWQPQTWSDVSQDDLRRNQEDAVRHIKPCRETASLSTPEHE